MWEYNNDHSKWERRLDYLLLDEFQYYQQEFESVSLYSKCLSGASYVPVNDTADIYDILGDYQPRNWFIGLTASDYVVTTIPNEFATPINRFASEYYDKFNYEYGLTLKNLFTPERTIKEAIDNYIYVDVATNEELTDLDELVINRNIDGVRLLEGHRVLIKNQKTTIVLPNTTDPDTYFEGAYTIVVVVGTNTEYEYYNSDNGIYKYTSNLLVREDDLDDYDTCVRFSVSVKLGSSNQYKQFHLSRLSSGYFPTTLLKQPLDFTEKKNWLIRNIVDYNNLFDINYYDILKHEEQIYDINGITYSIPERIISIGEFGVIINNQSGISNIIRNKYKENLRSISQTTKYYWVVGDNGVLLKIRKHDFEIERIIIDSSNGLKSISFFNDLNGVAIGDLNTILITNNGGISWVKETISSFDSFNFNKVVYKDINNFFIAGNNGVFIHFKNDINGWVAYRRRISNFIDTEDEFVLVDDVNDILHTNVTSWNPTYNYGTQSTTSPKDLLFLVTDDDNIIVHDLDDSIPLHTDFIYLDFDGNDYSDIQGISRKGSTNTFYFTGLDKSTDESGIFSFDLDNFQNIGIGNSYSNTISSTYSAVYESSYYPNKMFDYEGIDFLISGNNSLLKTSIYSATFSFNDLDSTFEDKLKSKLLFLDYDISSKVNFFTDDGIYRLPESTEFGLTASSGNYFEFKPIEYPSSAPSFMTQSEINWWNYWQDSKLTFEYYANPDVMTDSVKVLMSSTFSYDTDNEISTNNITIESGDIINLAPSILDDGHSRFNGLTTSISAPVTLYDIFLYNYLMVIRYSTGFNASVGDVIRLESDVVSDNFIVNKIVTLGGYDYAYLFTEFNNNIIKLLSDTTITIKNLNLFSDLTELEVKFNSHPISNGYELTVDSNVVEIDAKFNNLTSYYNLGTEVCSNYGTFSMTYQDSFMKFGYKPTYNILDYLEYINNDSLNPTFYANKEFLVMPVYSGIPVSSSPVNECYIDYNIDDNNKLTFGEGLEFEWESIFINTFVDITLYDDDSNIATTEKLLVMNKYQDESTGFYILEFHKKMIYPDPPQTTPIINVDITSRRSLLQISEDLQDLNNIQRAYRQKEYKGGTIESGYLWDVSYETLEDQLNFKVNTDSYAKIFLSDYTIIENLSGVIYSDFKGDLALNITKLESEKTIEILNTGSYSGDLFISCFDKHELSTGDGATFEFTGGTGSSEELNNQYFGYHTVTVIDEYNLVLDISFGTPVTVGNDVGTLKYVKKDPFLNYQPIDIIDVGVDKRGKIAVELLPENTRLIESTYSLINVDYDKHRFRLVDGLDIETLAINYHWIYEAEITDAIIGTDLNGLVWYKGIWECGRWFGGTWLSGTWLSGDWYDGIWKSKIIKDNYINVEVDEKSSDHTKSIWYSGRWFNGTWEDGTWATGRWYDGIWEDGIWYNGIWNDGTWNNGKFTGGAWVYGKWNDGYFSTLNGPAYWIDGTWEGGDFENGMWFNGSFDSKNNTSRFGTKAYSSRAAIWQSGDWISGSFHSRLNLDTDGNYDVSDIHKYSIWKTGNWYDGNFYGGVVYNVDFRSGVWHGGISEDIQVLGLSASENNIIIDGLYTFNIGDELTIIDNNLGGTYSNYGSNSVPGRYTILQSLEDELLDTTIITVNEDITDDVSGDIGLWLVSRFRNCNWKSGIWTNGLYENGLWEGGIWYNGVFKAKWM